MRKSILAVILLVSAGCGGPPFMGTFQGVATTTGSCSDGSAVPSSNGAFTLVLTENGNTASWMAGCGATATAQINGNTASVSQFTCPATTQNGTTTTITFTGGTLALNGTSLTVDLITTVTLSGAVTGSCNTTTTGTLARQN